MTSRMPTPSVLRSLNTEQLISGHLRIDLLKPMTKGNLIMLKGKRNTGKTNLTASIISNFLKEN
jgi:F0F1-type ATP synthase alpha subunit